MDEVSKKIIEHLKLIFLNTNITTKPISKGHMFTCYGPDLTIGSWVKIENSWIWKYHDSSIVYVHRFTGIEPRYLDKNKWAFAGLNPDLSFSSLQASTKIIYYDLGEDKVLKNYSLEYLVPFSVLNKLKEHISSLDIKTANTFFKNFNYNPDQIEFLLNNISKHNFDDNTNDMQDKVNKVSLAKGEWIYVGKSPKTSTPVWFYKFTDESYYINGYNYFQGDEPRLEDQTGEWILTSDLKKEYKASNIEEFLKNFLIENKIIEGSSYDKINIESNEGENLENTELRLSLYERAMKGEFKDIIREVKKDDRSFIEAVDEYASEKELEYKNIEITQTNKTFQLSYEEVLKEIERVSAIDLFDSNNFIKARGGSDTDEKGETVLEKFNLIDFIEEFKSRYRAKCKKSYFCIIELENKKVKTIFPSSKIDSNSLDYQKLMLIAKSSKKASYFKLDEKNYILENLVKPHYILIQKDEPFSISEKFKCRKLVEELRAAYILD